MKDKDFAKVYERNYKRSFLFALKSATALIR